MPSSRRILTLAFVLSAAPAAAQRVVLEPVRLAAPGVQGVVAGVGISPISVGVAPGLSAAPSLGAPAVGLSLLPSVVRMAQAPLSGPAPAAEPAARPVLAQIAAASSELAQASIGQAHARAAELFDVHADRPPKQLELPFPLPEGVSAGVGPGLSLPNYFSADPAEHAWLSEVVWASEQSRTGRRILRRVEKLAQRRGRPIALEVSQLRSNNGEYVYDTDLVVLASEFRKKPAAEAAPTFVHELLHVLQKAEELPADSLEMELEAHIVSLLVMRELGLKFEAGSFYRSSNRKFKGPFTEYVEWLAKEYDHNLRIVGRKSWRKYLAELEENLAKTEKRIARQQARLEIKKRNLARMATDGSPESVLATYREEHLGAVERNLSAELRNLAWQKRDVEMLRDPVSRARYQKYAQRVMGFARRAHARYGNE